MYARSLSAFAAVIALGAGLLALTHCELLVNLDRGEVDGAVPDGCAICSNAPDGGEDAGQDGALHDGGDASAHDASADGASTGDGGDASPTDGGSDGAATDAPPGE
ncbi:MAG TPA: hypothetical protein VMI75_09260 [Polyangiaceae bacterium]|nr:hypothetical protein [Polyangiaceae bacterium]